MTNELNTKDLQCCGNCVNGLMSDNDIGFFCIAKNKEIYPDCVCESWKNDMMEYLERMIEKD